MNSYSQEETNAFKLKGVIELGASGFNSFIISMDKEKNWKLIKSQYGKSYTLDGIATTYTTKVGLKNYMNDLKEDGVADEDIHFVVSSGAYQQEITGPIINNLKEMDFRVNIVDSEEEGQLAFKSVVPDSQRNSTMMIDVGSSNTKISWTSEGKIVSISTYGSRFFKSDEADSIVLKNLKKTAAKIPESKTETVYLIGGMPYKYAKQTRQGNERYTKLRQIETYTPQSEKERCGSIILKELRDTAGIQEYIFDWDSNFSIGFLLELPF
ncbi:MAG: hypothetical protein AB8B73_15895 [Ekhidna sp.]